MAISYYTFTDQLPPGMVFAGGPYPNLGTPETPVFQIPVEDLQNGGTFAFQVATYGAPTDTPLINVASLTDGTTTLYAQDGGVIIINPIILLSVQKAGTVNMPEDGNGGTITWNVTITNVGTNVATQINVTDTLQQGQAVVGMPTATDQNGDYFNASYEYNTSAPNTMIFMIQGDLPPGQTVTLTFQTSLPNIPNADLNIDPGTLINNTANLDDGTTSNPATVTLPAPTFTARKIASTFNPEPGSTFTYTVTATNTGNLSAMPFTLTDPLPTATDAAANLVPLITYNGGPVSATLSNYADPVSITTSGTATTPIFTLNQPVRPGQTVAITFQVTLSPTAPLGVAIPNSQSYVTGFPNGPKTPVTELQPITPATPTFTNANKGSTPANVTTPGSLISYTITATNSGTLPTDQLTLTDTLPDYLTYLGNATVQVAGTTVPPGSYTLTQNPLTFTITDPSYQLPAGGTVQVAFDTLLSPDTPIGTYIENSAFLQTGPNDQNGAYANSHLPFVGSPKFSGVSKVASLSLVAPGDTFTYTIQATQSGNAPTDPLTITDTLPDWLTYQDATVTAHIDGNPVNVAITGDPDTPIFTITDPLRSGSTVDITYTVLVDENVPPGSSLTNNALITGYPGDPGTNASVTNQVGNPPFTQVSKSPSTRSIYPGDTYTYTIQAKNSTNQALDPFVINDTLPPGLTLAGDPTLTIAGTTDPVTAAVNGQQVTFTSNQPLPPESSATLTFQVTAANSLANRTQLINTADLKDPEGNDHSVTAFPVTVTSPIFPSCQKVPSQANANIGDTFTYTITATNSGGAPTTNPFSITDTLPTGLTYAGNPVATLNGQAIPVTQSGDQPLTFSLAGTAGNNDTVTLSFQVTVNDQAQNGLALTNTATIYGYPNDPGYPVPGQPVGIGSPDFSTSTKTATDDDGNSLEGQTIADSGTIVYHIHVVNTSDGQAVGPFQVTDTLPNGTTYDPSLPSIGTFVVPGAGTFQIPMNVTVAQTGTNTALTFEHPVQNTYIPAGTTVDFDYRVFLGPNVDNPLHNRATVHADPNDPGVVTSQSTVNIASPSFTDASKTVNPDPPVAGRPFTYTVTATNTGTVAAPSLTITDPLPSPLLYNPESGATATLDGATVPVTVASDHQTPTFTINTPIPAGSTISLTFQVHAPYHSPAQTLSNTASVSGTPATNTTNLQAPPAPTDALSKTSSPGILFPGGTIDYTLNWKHQGLPTYQNLTLTDVLPPYVSFPVGATANVTVNGATQQIPNTGTAAVPIFNVPGPLHPGTQATLDFTASLASNAPEGTSLTNNAISDNGIDQAFAADDGVTVASSNIALTKIATPDTVYPGQTAHYTITATNNGTLPAAISLTEPMANMTNIVGDINGTTIPLTQNGTSFTSSEMLPTGANFTLNFDTIVPIDTTLTNSVTYKAYPSDPGTTATHTLPIQLTQLNNGLFSKSSAPSVVAPGGTVTYTFNFNSQDAINTDLILTDFLPDYTTYLAGAHVTVNDTTYDVANTGTATVPRFSMPAPIPENSNLTLTFTALFNPDTNVGGHFQNTAVLHDGSHTFLRASDTPGFFAGALFVPIKTSDVAVANPGDRVTYTINAQNVGNMPASPLAILETLPLGIRFTPDDTVTALIDDVPTTVTTTHPSGPRQPVFTLADPVPPGATVVLTFTALINPTNLAGSTLVNSATLTSYPGDPGTTCWDSGITIETAPPAPTPPPELPLLKAACCAKTKVAPCKTLPLKTYLPADSSIKACQGSTFLLDPNTTYEVTFKVKLRTDPRVGAYTIGLSLDGCPITGSRITVRPKTCTAATLTQRITFTTGDTSQKLKLVNYSRSSVVVTQSWIEIQKM